MGSVIERADPEVTDAVALQRALEQLLAARSLRAGLPAALRTLQIRVPHDRACLLRIHADAAQLVTSSERAVTGPIPLLERIRRGPLVERALEQPWVVITDTRIETWRQGLGRLVPGAGSAVLTQAGEADGSPLLLMLLSAERGGFTDGDGRRLMRSSGLVGMLYDHVLRAERAQDAVVLAEHAARARILAADRAGFDDAVGEALQGLGAALGGPIWVADVARGEVHGPADAPAHTIAPLLTMQAELAPGDQRVTPGRLGGAGLIALRSRRGRWTVFTDGRRAPRARRRLSAFQGLLEALDLVDARRALEHRLATRGERLRAVLDTARDAVLVFDVDHRLVDLNASARDLIGPGPLDATPVTLESLLEIDPDHPTAARGEARVQRAALLCAQGPVPVELTVDWTTPPADRLLVVTARDLRPVRALQSMLAESERLAALGALATGIAHDFNNLVAPILACSGLLEDLLEPGSEPYEIARDISVAARRASETVRRLRPIETTPERHPAPLDLNAALTELAGLVGRSSEGVRLSIDVAPHALPVSAHPIDLHHLLLNLLTHAGQSAVRGGRNVRVRTARLRPAVGDEESLVTLDVEDDGPEIPADLIPRLFQPYVVTGPRSAFGELAPGSLAQGTLALSAAHRAVRHLGGSIEHAPSPPGGNRFRVILPGAHALPPLDSGGRAARALVLLAADRAHREGWPTVAHALGFQAVVVGEPEDMLLALRADEPRAAALVLHGVPSATEGLAWIDAARRIRPGLPIVLADASLAAPPLRVACVPSAHLDAASVRSALARLDVLA